MLTILAALGKFTEMASGPLARIIHDHTLTRRVSAGVVTIRPRSRVGLVCGTVLPH